METCRICTEAAAVRLLVATAPTRTYLHCQNCEAVFVVPGEHLSLADEETFYGLHENSPSDPRYRNYLTPVLDLAWKAWRDLNSGKQAPAHMAWALDFGSGPLEVGEESVVCEFFRERGLAADAYDPYFRPMDLANRRYDVIVACEVIEHFRSPMTEFEKLISHLSVDGVLAIQTEFFPGLEKFDNWYYRRDPTHVVFYSPKTFAALAQRFGLEVSQMQDGKRVVFRKTCQDFSNPVS